MTQLRPMLANWDPTDFSKSGNKIGKITKKKYFLSKGNARFEIGKINIFTKEKEKNRQIATVNNLTLPFGRKFEIL